MSGVYPKIEGVNPLPNEAWVHGGGLQRVAEVVEENRLREVKQERDVKHAAKTTFHCVMDGDDIVSVDQLPWGMPAFRVRRLADAHYQLAKWLHMRKVHREWELCLKASRETRFVIIGAQ